MRGNYNKAYSLVRKYEGGNVDDKRDPGGRTSRGVTQRTYDAYRRAKRLPPRDVYKADEDEVADIYKTQYWNAVKGDDLPNGIDVVMYDTAINSGPSRSVKLMQASLNARAGLKLSVDGVLGTQTLQAILDDEDNDLLIAEFGRRRQGFYKGLKTFKTFGNGWTARNKNVTKTGQAWASGSIGPVVAPVAAMSGNAKARDEDVKTTYISTEKAATVAAGTTTATGLAETLQNAASNIQPLVEFSTIMQYVFAALTVASVGYSVYAAYKSFKSRKALNGEATA